METQPEFGFKELAAYVVGDMAKAVSERVGETREQQAVRSQAAAYMVMGLMPRDVIETLLAGHCMMFHELTVDSIRNTLRGEADKVRGTSRSSIVTMNKTFDHCLARLEYYQTRPSQGRRDVPETAAAKALDAAGSGDGATRPEGSGEVRKPDPRAAAPVAEAGDVAAGTRPDAAASETEEMAVFHPSAEAIAACRANPEAMAALDACDPARFARAMGVEQPSTAYIAAAAGQMSGWNGRATAAAPVQVQRPGDANDGDGLSGRVKHDGMGGSGSG